MLLVLNQVVGVSSSFYDLILNWTFSISRSAALDIDSRCEMCPENVFLRLFMGRTGRLENIKFYFASSALRPDMERHSSCHNNRCAQGTWRRSWVTTAYTMQFILDALFTLEIIAVCSSEKRESHRVRHDPTDGASGAGWDALECFSSATEEKTNI